MTAFMLKKPLDTYAKRFNRFLWLLIAVKGLEPRDMRLWRVMDGAAFQDTETALETELVDAGRSLDADGADRLTLAVMDEANVGDRRR